MRDYIPYVKEMPKYDFVCPAGHEQENVIVPYGTRPPCPNCGGATEIIWKSSFPNIINDDVPGGFTIHNMSAQPETFYSKSEHRRRVKELGLTVRDTHVGQDGTDKSKFTSRWV